MSTIKWANSATKEEIIAVKLSGRVKNFTGRTPAIIKVRIQDSMVSIHLKWIITDKEKDLLKNAINQELENAMRNRLNEFTKKSLYRVFEGIFGRQTVIKQIDGDLFQENLIVHAQISELAS